MRGNGWTALQVSPIRWAVSIASEYELMASLLDFLNQRDIRSGGISGVGAAHKVTLRFRDPKTKSYIDTTIEEQMEIVNLTGNVFELDGEVGIHVHGTFGRQNLTACAGHVKDIWIRGAGELFITVDDVTTDKTPDAATGLNIYKLG